MYYHVVGVGSWVVFRKKPAKTPHPQHDSIGKMQVYQGFDEQTGQAILFVFFTGYSNVERIGLLRVERIAFCGGGCPACLISTCLLSCSDNLAHLFYMLDHKKIGTFSEFLHKIKAIFFSTIRTYPSGFFDVIPLLFSPSLIEIVKGGMIS